MSEFTTTHRFNFCGGSCSQFCRNIAEIERIRQKRAAQVKRINSPKWRELQRAALAPHQPANQPDSSDHTGQIARTPPPAYESWPPHRPRQ